MKKMGLFCGLCCLLGCQSVKEFTSRQPTEADLPFEALVVITKFRSLTDATDGRAYLSGGKTRIEIIRPRHPEDNYAFCVLGHEVWHEVTGDFHRGFKSNCLSMRGE